LRFDHIRDEPGVIALVLPRGQVAIWQGHEWRRVGLNDWRKTYLEPLGGKFVPFSIVQMPKLTEADGNARQIQYPVTEGIVQQLLTGPWHYTMARIMEWVLDS
jgi:hypothetical protein